MLVNVKLQIFKLLIKITYQIYTPPKPPHERFECLMSFPERFEIFSLNFSLVKQNFLRNKEMFCYRQVRISTLLACVPFLYQNWSRTIFRSVLNSRDLNSPTQK